MQASRDDRQTDRILELRELIKEKNKQIEELETLCEAHRLLSGICENATYDMLVKAQDILQAATEKRKLKLAAEEKVKVGLYQQELLVAAIELLRAVPQGEDCRRLDDIFKHRDNIEAFLKIYDEGEKTE